jgi:GTP-binding protein
VAADWETIDRELDLYGGELADKPRVTAMNKVDALDDDERAERRAALEAVAGPVMLMSGVSREGVTEVLRALRAEIDEDRLRLREAGEERQPWRP